MSTEYSPLYKPKSRFAPRGRGIGAGDLHADLPQLDAQIDQITAPQRRVRRFPRFHSLSSTNRRRRSALEAEISNNNSFESNRSSTPHSPNSVTEPIVTFDLPLSSSTRPSSEGLSADVPLGNAQYAHARGLPPRRATTHPTSGGSVARNVAQKAIPPSEEQRLNEEALYAERAVLEEAVRRERRARNDLAQRVFSLHNALRHSRQASVNHAIKLDELQRSLNSVEQDKAPIDTLLEALSKNFRFKECALCAALPPPEKREHARRSALEDDQSDTLLVKSISPFKRAPLS